MGIIYRNAKRIEHGVPFHINHLGYGVFETFLLMFNSDGAPKILGLDLHYKRLENGCKSLFLNYQASSVYDDLLEKTIKELDPKPGSAYRVRIVIYETEWFFQLEAIERDFKPLKLKTVNIERNMPEVKSCSALPSVYSSKMAEAGGSNEALLLNKDNIITETSWGNFFWFDVDNNLYTADEGILRGVTRDLIIDLLQDSHKINLGNYKFDIGRIKSAFVTKSTNGVVEVLSIDGKELETGKPFFRDLQKRYESLYVE